MADNKNSIDYSALALEIKSRGKGLGFDKVGIADTDLTKAEARLSSWLQQGYQGQMDYLSRHGIKRSRPTALVPYTRSVITVRMDYLPPHDDPEQVLKDPVLAFISRYALGRDYHKTLRKRLQKLADSLCDLVGEFGYRVFVDSAPVLEKPLAVKAGLGWMGKHTNVLSRDAGSWFFLGELYTDLPLPADSPVTNHCGSCQVCIDICPTQAIVAPYQLDARRCVSYLTIELQGSIPEAYRAQLGNRIYGCDDCQLVCPWNRFAAPTDETDFLPRHALDTSTLTQLFAWTEAEFLRRLEGSAIRRIGWERWLRNIAVALGNAPTSDDVRAALHSRSDHPSGIVREHVQWALQQHAAKLLKNSLDRPLNV